MAIEQAEAGVNFDPNFMMYNREEGGTRLRYIGTVLMASTALASVLVYGAHAEKQQAIDQAHGVVPTSSVPVPVVSIAPTTRPSRHEMTSGVTSTPSVKPSATRAATQNQSTCLNDLSTEQLLAATLFVGVKGDASFSGYQTSPEDTLKTINQYQVGNVVVLDNPAADAARHLRALTDPTKVYASLLVAANQAGGTASTVKDSIANVTDFPSPQTMAKTKTISQAEMFAQIQYAHLNKEYGINAVFGINAGLAPVTSKTTSADQSAFFGSDPTKVAPYVNAYLEAAHNAGLTAVVENAPGDGGATTSTQTGEAVLPPYATLQNRDLKVYNLLKGKLVNVMVSTAPVAKDAAGHSWTNGQPAALDPTVSKWLKDTVNVDGLIITDNLAAPSAQIGALDNKTHTPIGIIEAIKKAWLAGEDPQIVNVDKTEPLQKLLNDVLAAGKQLVADGQLPKSQLAAMAQIDFKTRGLNVCSLTPKP